jgi:hypothetical protein
MLACSMPHASDWLLAPPIPGLGLGLQSDVFRTALKFRLGLPLFAAPFPCRALSSDGKACPERMDVFGDHAPCCHNGTSLLFRHNNIRDILGHSARAAGLAAVVIEKKNQIDGSRVKPGDSNNIIVGLRPQLLMSLSLILCRKNILKLQWKKPVWQRKRRTTER